MKIPVKQPYNLISCNFIIFTDSGLKPSPYAALIMGNISYFIHGWIYWTTSFVNFHCLSLFFSISLSLVYIHVYIHFSAKLLPFLWRIDASCEYVEWSPSQCLNNFNFFKFHKLGWDRLSPLHTAPKMHISSLYYKRDRDFSISSFFQPVCMLLSLYQALKF